MVPSSNVQFVVCHTTCHFSLSSYCFVIVKAGILFCLVQSVQGWVCYLMAWKGEGSVCPELRSGRALWVYCRYEEAPA